MRVIAEPDKFNLCLLCSESVNIEALSAPRLTNHVTRLVPSTFRILTLLVEISMSLSVLCVDGYRFSVAPSNLFLSLASWISRLIQSDLQDLSKLGRLVPLALSQLFLVLGAPLAFRTTMPYVWSLHLSHDYIYT